MRLLKPSWVSHDGKPIFSIDIHPDGSRFATGGQGEDSGKVIIWNMAPVKNAADEMNENVPKLLCQMDNHLACVNCVRWSYGGKYLASGGDDKLIMIWQTARYSVPSTIFGSGGSKMNIEQWRCVHTLRGHSGDVLDLAWSPDDLYIASGSVDNTILVWNAMRFPEIIKIVKGHSGLVKGVTWDPVGKFLASQSDDKSLKIWRTADWQLQAEVLEPFNDCGGTTHVLRLSWSPDGHYVVSAHAMNNSGPVAKIVERDGWKTRMDFVGHRKAVTVVRFNPVLFVKKVNGESAKLKQYSCCAIGSRDRSLSVWLTSLKRPLVVTHDLFKHSIMDISWSSSGFELVVCSWDGTIAYADFTPDELGKPMSQEEKERFHKQVYGISISSSKCTITSSLIENPDMLKIQQRHTMKQQTLANVQKPNVPPPPLVSSASRGNSLTSPQSTAGGADAVFSSPGSGSCSGLSPGKSVREQQIETRTKDGRRRITPVLLTPQLNFSEAPVPFGSTSKSSFSSSPKEPQANVTAPAAPPTNIPTTSQAMSALDSRIGKNATTWFSPKAKENKAKDDKGKDKEKGKPSDKAEKEKPQEKTPTKSATASCSVSSALLGAVSTTSTSMAGKRKVDTSAMANKRARKEAHSSTSKSQTSSLSHVSKQRSDSDKADHEDTTDKALDSRHTIIFPYPTPTNKLTVQIGGAESKSGMTLDLENNLQSAGLGTHTLKCSSGGKVVWETMVTSPGIALAGNRHVVCVACQNKSAHIFSPNGIRLMPAVVLDSAASILQCSGHFVMLVTSSGGVYVWDAKKVQAVVTNQSVQPVLTGQDVTISRASITDDGYPVISLSTQEAFTFSGPLGAWVQVAWTDDPLAANADYRSTVSSQDPFQAKGPLASLQGQSSRTGRQAARLFRHNPGRQQTATVSHLENQVAACLSLGSSKEYHFWLMTYARYLVQAGMESRLREMCEELLVPTHRLSSNERSDKSPRDRFILGFSKRDLLQEILPIIGSNIRLQRLFTEFKDQLSTLSVR